MGFVVPWIRLMAALLAIAFVGVVFGTETRPDSVPDDCNCTWTSWMNNQDYDITVGDNNSYANLRPFYSFCADPAGIECRSVVNPQVPFKYLPNDGRLVCNVSTGLECNTTQRGLDEHEPSRNFFCLDYEIRVACCACPQVATTPAATLAQSNLTENTTKDLNLTIVAAPSSIHDQPSGDWNRTTTTVETVTLEEVLPVYIIIVIIVTAILVLIAIICVVRCHAKRQKAEKMSLHYVGGDLGSFHRRPVSFTEVDNYHVPLPEPEQASISGPGTSLASSPEREKLADFEAGKLQFLPPGIHDQPDIVNSSRTPYSPGLLPQFEDEAPRKWLPDEYERSLEKQTSGSRPETRNWLSRAFAPTNKNSPYMEDSQM